MLLKYGFYSKLNETDVVWNDQNSIRILGFFFTILFFLLGLYARILMKED